MTRRLLAGICLLATVSCSPTEPTIDGSYVGLHVRGSVRAPDGAPVVGATVAIDAGLLATCTGSFTVSVPATADSVGAFARTLSTWNTPLDVCVSIAVAPPSAVSLSPQVITVKPARLASAFDTVVVDIVLPAAP